MQPQQPYAPLSQPSPNYDFIMNPGKPPKPSLFGGQSLNQRLLVAGGGLLAIIILITIVIKVLGSGNDYFPSMLAVVQQQQEIVHLTTAINQNTQTKLNTSNANLAVTLQLSTASSQSQLLSYLQKNGHKVSAGQLNPKVSTVTDQQLTTAAQAGTYDATFDSIVKSQLQTYQQTLAAAYNKDKGAKGRTLLKDDYRQAQMLLNSLGS